MVTLTTTPNPNTRTRGLTKIDLEYVLPAYAGNLTSQARKGCQCCSTTEPCNLHDGAWFDSCCICHEMHSLNNRPNTTQFACVLSILVETCKSQTMAHLLCCRLLDEPCSSQDPITVTERTKPCARKWHHFV